MLLILNPTDPQYIREEDDSEFEESKRPKDNTLLALSLATALSVGLYFVAKAITKRENDKKQIPQLGQA